MSLDKTHRIAQNTIMLYIRMLLIIVVTLYTSRIILNTLGVEDYGIYNVVSGVIVMLSFLNSSLGGAGARFIAFTLGKGKQDELKRIFSTVLCVHFILAGGIFIMGETVGLWFVLHKLVIPVERLTAALWVYHCSILTTVVAIISVPYNSLIIAHERMGAFAYISIIEVILKLFVVGLLVYIPYDKLIVYAILYLVVQVIIRLIYNYYCFTHFPESKTPLKWYPHLLKKIAVYAGWTINGNLAVIGYTQGINILLNLFFGPVVNAARGIAVQVQAAVMTFVQNFQMAIRPQIIKSYAISDLEYMQTLVIASSKYGLFLMLILAFPIFLCIKSVLNIWLGIVPEYTVSFVCIMLLIGLLAPLREALINAIHATGDIKKFQIYEGTSLLMIVPSAYILLKVFHISPESVMLVYFFVEIFAQCIRVWIVLPKISISYSTYFHKIMLPVLLLLPFCVLPVLFLPIPDNLSFVELVACVIAGALYALFCICLIGLTTAERRMMYIFVKNKISHEKAKS